MVHAYYDIGVVDYTDHL